MVSGLVWTYDQLGRRVRATWADGSYWVYTYDLYGQLVSGRRYWADGRPVAGQQFEYRHDAIGNRTAGGWGGDELGQSLRWSTNTVNRLNQYTSRTVPGYVGVSGEAAEAATVTLWWGSNEWARAIQQGRYWYGEALVNNATGAVWVVITNLGVVRGQPDRVQSETRSAFVAQTPETLIHNADGNLVRDGRWLYYWDAENRLTRVITVAGPSSSFRRVDWKYDAQGRRVRQTSYVLSNGVWQVVEDLKLVSDPELFGRHIAELNATNNALVRAYIWGLDMSETVDGAGGVGGLLWVWIQTGPAAGTHLVCYDGNANLWNLVSASTGTETARYEYGPFGEALRLSGPPAKANPFRFSTKRTEDISGLVLYEYRAYTPTLGRWLSRDPIEEGGGFGLFVFIINAPVRSADSLGLQMAPPGWPWPTDPSQPFPPAPPPTPKRKKPAVNPCDDYKSFYKSFLPTPTCMCNCKPIPDHYPERAQKVCDSFMEKYDWSDKVHCVARCLVAVERATYRMPYCSLRATIRLSAHLACYVSCGFYPWKGLPHDGVGVGVADLLWVLARCHDPWKQAK